MRNVISLICLLAFVTACSVLNKNDLDKDLKVFLTDFNNKLSQSDEVIWKQFMTLQNKEEIFKVIRVLQNRESKDITSKLEINSATALWEDGFLNLTVPILLITDKADHKSSSITLSLIKRANQFLIARVDGEEVFQAFSVLRNQIEYGDELRKRLADVRLFYDQARELQKNYDSVVWYINHNFRTYFYATNGSFNFDSLKNGLHSNFKMGLINSEGEIVVPVEFDLIGNPSFFLEGAIEVRRGGRVGYYSLEGKELVAPIYDWLLPHREGQTIAIVKRDSTYGWLDKNYGFHHDFPSIEARRMVEGFGFLTSTKLTLGRGYQDLIHILYPISDNMSRGNGLVISPAYYERYGILPLINDGFITMAEEDDSRFFQYGNIFEENTNEPPLSITESIVALISNFNSRFIGGRGEFYGSHKITLFDKKSNIVGSVVAGGERDFRFRKINENLYESSAIYNDEGYGPYGPTEYNFPYYSYFQFDSGKFTQLASTRLYQFTQFIKIDSSYLTGKFLLWDALSKKSDTTTFVSQSTIREMRDEILAFYGYIFPDPQTSEIFKSAGEWYKPTTESYDEIYSRATEIDKHNLDFLNRMIDNKSQSKPI